MKLRTKTMITVTVASLLIAFSGRVVNTIANKMELEAVDAELSADNLERCFEQLEENRSKLGRMLKAVEHYKHLSPEMAHFDFFITEEMAIADLDFVLTFSEDGTLLDWKASGDMPLPHEFVSKPLDEGHPFLRPETTGSRSGVLSTSAYPILYASVQAPTPGASNTTSNVVMIQALTNQFFEAQKVSHWFECKVLKKGAKESSDSPQLDSPSVSALLFPVSDNIGAYTMNVTKPLKTADGADDLLLQSTTPRSTTLISHRNFFKSGVISTVIAVVVLVGLGYALQRLLYAPLAKLSKQILNIGEDLVLPEGLAETRKDEIGTLTREFSSLLGKLKNRSAEMESVQRLDLMLAACESTLEASQVFSVIVSKMFPEMKGALSLMSPSRDLLEVKATFGKWPCATSFHPSECWAVRRGQRHIRNQGDAVPPCGHIDEPEKGAYLCIPLAAQGETLGVLHLIGAGEEPISKGAERMARRLAQHTGLALANIRLREALRQQAVRDPLTGLFNRRFLEESFQKELSRAKRKSAPIGVLMIDLDHFKRFNDNHGHEAGDYVLKQVGQKISKGFREGDIPCRYGGEEFTVLLPEADEDTLVKRARQLAEAVRSCDFRFRDQVLPAVTLSIGAASYPTHGDTPKSILAAADKALYKAKAEGRDRVVRA